ncbi:large-conductance mechanosensitive channel [Gamsiella multidivaricata]|uniref:large-conductance mechanosensitive channel n=1 Tax=Gamsiella multidivaricata TaxID=101098 RepID=UPI002220CF64|nr:large-conductance mechanosensitive channel [Gamsiella multidivaricata]KAG0369137.1 hypothetical protein BGZ54_000251 [Gamsiella multidivaricata]KAI7823042.1 large-conductance mechanosensitive channel [Gamsiella multidivaricata]
MPSTPDNNSGQGARRNRIHDVEDSARISLLHGGETISRKAKTFWGHFKDFIDNGNVIALAVGLILGASFTALVNSLVDDIISPPLGITLGQASLENLFVVIKDGKNASTHYMTLEQARDDGAVCIAYGRFIQMTFNFFTVALVLFILIRLFQSFQQEEIIKSKVKCKYCRQKINKNATRCQFCTSWQDAAEPNHVVSPAPLTRSDGYMSN